MDIWRICHRRPRIPESRSDPSRRGDHRYRSRSGVHLDLFEIHLIEYAVSLYHELQVQSVDGPKSCLPGMACDLCFKAK